MEDKIKQLENTIISLRRERDAAINVAIMCAEDSSNLSREQLRQEIMKEICKELSNVH